MKIDTYTKVLLTGIFLFLGVIAFDLKPDIEAHASSSSGIEMIVNNPIAVTDKGKMFQSENMWHLQNGKIRLCNFDLGKTHCTKWSD